VNSRLVTLYGTIADATSVIVVQNIPLMAESIIAELMLLANESKEPIKILINSPGGSVQAGLLIVDAIEHLQAIGIDVETIVIGQSSSMATPILASGTLGKRYAWHRAIIHGHRARVGAMGNEDDIEGQARHMKQLTEQLYEILTQKTKSCEYHLAYGENPMPEVLEVIEQLSKSEKTADKERLLKLRTKYTKELFSKETFLRADQALKAGIIDHVLQPGNQYLNNIFKPSNPTDEVSK